MFEHGARGRGRVAAAGADGTQAVVGLDHVAVAGDQKRGLAIRHHEQGFEMTKGAVFAPFLGQLDSGFLEIAGMLLELGFEALEEGDGVGGGTRKTCDDFVIVEAASLAGGVLHYVIAHGHLAVSDENNFVVFAHA